MSIITDKVSSTIKIDPTGFDVTINAILIGLGAEKYIEIFKKQNIGQCALAELTDDDLKQLGVDDPEVRSKLLSEVKNLPLYEEVKSEHNNNFGPTEIADVFDDTAGHLYRIYLSMMANTLALKKTKKLSDCILYKDKYASDIAMSTLNEISSIINSLDKTVHSQLTVHKQEPKNKNKKKILVGTIGSAVIAVLTVLFVRSLKQLK